MINRHFQESESILEDELNRYERLWKPALEGIIERPGSVLGSQVNKALSAFSVSIVANKQHDVSVNFLRILRTLGVANFQLSVSSGNPFSIDLCGESFEIVGNPTTAYVDTDTWLNVYFSAAILRDMAAIHFLRKVPESIHQTADLKPDQFDLAFIRAMKGLFDAEAKIGQLLIDAMEASDPDSLDSSRLDYATNILLPQLPLYRCILSSDQGEFNEMLEEAVLKHKDFWDKGENKYNSEGWIALPLIAASVIAFDNKGFEMTFETDYIPSWLVKREF